MRGDEFEQLYTAEAAGLFSFLAYRTGDRALAQDLVADTFERAYRARKRFDAGRSSERTWLYSIAMNLVRDHGRRVQAARRAEDRLEYRPESASDAGLERVGEHEDLYEALRALSDEERTAVALRFGADLTVPEIAAALGESLTTVEGRVYRALRKLRAALDA
jgi:RNA polymerase sigma-70 factor (ECF subfamily)